MVGAFLFVVGGRGLRIAKSVLIKGPTRHFVASSIGELAGLLDESLYFRKLGHSFHEGTAFASESSFASPTFSRLPPPTLGVRAFCRPISTCPKHTG